MEPDPRTRYLAVLDARRAADASVDLAAEALTRAHASADALHDAEMAALGELERWLRSETSRTDG